MLIDQAIQFLKKLKKGKVVSQENYADSATLNYNFFNFHMYLFFNLPAVLCPHPLNMAIFVTSFINIYSKNLSKKTVFTNTIILGNI